MNTENLRPTDTSADSVYTVGALSREIISRLEPRFGHREAVAMNRIIWEELKEYKPADMILKSDLHVSEYMLARINETVDRVLADEPIQYVLGRARFYGMDLEVNPAVLIPRPETARLVDIIADREKVEPDLRILDIGTGSGCIAIALARILPFSIVSAIDISPEAIDTARRNAAALRARVEFRQSDILRLPPPDIPSFDIIVSNPPYIMEGERSSMESYVADREPAQALFVPDDDPLRFYSAICIYAMEALTDGGHLYFELNPLTADRLTDDMKRAGWEEITLSRDDQGKIRFLTATRPSRL